MLTEQMQAIITKYPAGFVATIRRDGTPAVSPKGTFVMLDPRTLAYGNIRSPHTLSNLRGQSDLEVCFLDVLARQSVRVKGEADIIKGDDPAMTDVFTKAWPDYVDRMTHYVVIKVTGAELITTPAYDMGQTREQLVESYKEKLAGYD